MSNFCFIILHFKDSDMTNQCLESIYTTAEAGDEIIVVKNSHDYESADIGQKHRGIHFQVVRPPELNPGFAKGMNFGASQAKPSSYLTFINNDTIFPPEFREEMLRSFQIGGEKLAAVAPKIVYAHKPDIIQSICLDSTIFGTRSAARCQKALSSSVTGQVPVKILSGCVLTIRRSVFDQLNGWPDVYFFGGEDVELSKKIRNSGYSVSVIADVAVRHFSDDEIGGGANHSRSVLFFIVNTYMTEILRRKRNGTKINLFMYKIALSINMIFVMPLKRKNIGGGCKSTRQNYIVSHYLA